MLKLYHSIIELKTFINAIEMAIEKTPSGGKNKKTLRYVEGIAKGLLYSKISILLKHKI